MKTPPSPHFLIAAANAFVGLDLSATQARTGVAGVTGCFLREVGAAPGSAVTWDTAFAHHVGYWSHYDTYVGCSSWPLPPVATADELARFAKARGLISHTPMAGDVFLLKSAVHSGFARTGVVVRVEPRGHPPVASGEVACTVIEGDTNEARVIGGGQVLRHLRIFSSWRGDRFIRWTRRTGEYARREPEAA